jgi:amino acid adenylation domain-containing protein
MVVGFSLPGQAQVEGRELVGHCVNFLPLRMRVDGAAPFGEHMLQARGRLLDASDHRSFTFGLLIQQLNLPRDPSRLPLMSVAFNLDPAYEGVAFGDLEAMPGSIPRVCENFDLFFNVVDLGTRYQIECRYNADLWAPATIARWLAEYSVLLDAACADASVPVGRLPVATVEEASLLAQWNQTQRRYPSGTLHQLFEEQARRSPEAVAVVAGEQRITYAELDARANRLARRLRGAGAKADRLVALYAQRSADMVVGVLGILKSGAAYVPIDPAYPPPRVAFLFEDSGALMAVTQSSLRAKLPPGVEHVLLDDPEQAGPLPREDDLEPGSTGSDLAYVIYTSGSTGVPKGVAIEHHSPVALIDWARSVYSPEELAGVLFGTSICFDLSIFELFAPLATGGKVIVAENVVALRELPACSEVTLVNTVPSAITELLREGALGPGIRTVNLAGEPLTPELVDRIYEQSSVQRVFDLYGPSEDTTYSTCALRARGGIETIGRPISNTRAYVLDALGQPVPLGAVGELHLAGAGVARGYLHRPELTAERFLPDPFVPGERMYRTGDRARQLVTGELVFLGRADHQVKLRGFRIEPGEVEQALRGLSGVRDAVVVADQARRCLVAYYTGEPIEPRRLRELLAATLPAHFVPQHFQHLGQLPLTPSGKVDRKALPAIDPSVGRASVPGAMPRTQVEEALLRICREVLGHPGFGIYDNFFEAGGHSLQAMQVVDLAHRHGILIDMRQLFLHGTVAGLAAGALAPRVQAKDTGPAALVALRAEGSRPPLFLLHSLPGDLLHYGNLVRFLGNDQPVYGFHATAPMHGNGSVSIADLARSYVEMLLSFRPEGTLHLAGWCFGGVVAHEMAVQLRARGRKMGLLGLIESWPNEPMARRVTSKLLAALRTRRGIAALGRRLLGGCVSPEQEDPYNLFALEMDGGPFAHRRAVYEQNDRANFEHVTHRYAGPVVLYRAGEQPPGSLRLPDYGWAPYVGRVEVIDIPGPHRLLMDRQHSKRIAELIRRAIDGAAGP